MTDARQEPLVGLAVGAGQAAQGQHADHHLARRHRHAEPVPRAGERVDRRDAAARTLGLVVVRPDRLARLEHGGHEPDGPGGVPERRAHVGCAVHDAEHDFEVSMLLVAQHDRHIGGVEDAAGLGVNRPEQGRPIELAGDRPRELEQHGQLLDLAAVLLVELRVLQRERGLIAEGLEQPHFGLGEDPARHVTQRQGADDAPLRPEWHGEHRAGAGLPHRRRHLVAQDDRGIVEDVGRRHGPSLDDRDPGRPDSRREDGRDVRDVAKATPARQGDQRAIGS